MYNVRGIILSKNIYEQKVRNYAFGGYKYGLDDYNIIVNNFHKLRTAVYKIGYENVKSIQWIIDKQFDYCKYFVECLTAKYGLINLYEITPKNLSRNRIALIASKYGNVNILKYLVEKCGIEKFNNIVMEVAISYGKIECVKYLFEIGFIIESSLFSIAGYYGNIDFLKFSHENNITIDYKAGLYAAANGHLHCLEYLHSINHKFDMRTYFYAQRNKQTLCCNFLLKHIII